MLLNLYYEMKKQGLNQKELAKELGVTIRTVSKKVTGKTAFTSKEMFALRDKFFKGLSLDYLFAIEDKIEEVTE